MYEDGDHEDLTVSEVLPVLAQASGESAAGGQVRGDEQTPSSSSSRDSTKRTSCGDSAMRQTEDSTHDEEINVQVKKCILALVAFGLRNSISAQRTQNGLQQRKLKMTWRKSRKKQHTSD